MKNLSTGPRTPEGKRIVSQNARKFGFRAKTPLFTDEERAQINTSTRAFARDFDADTAEEHYTCAQMAEALCQMNRILQIESEICAGTDLPQVVNRLYTLSRYWVHYERTFHKGIKQLEAKLRNQIAAAALPLPIPERKTATSRTKLHEQTRRSCTNKLKSHPNRRKPFCVYSVGECIGTSAGSYRQIPTGHSQNRAQRRRWGRRRGEKCFQWIGLADLPPLAGQLPLTG